MKVHIDIVNDWEKWMDIIMALTILWMLFRCQQRKKYNFIIKYYNQIISFYIYMY